MAVRSNMNAILRLLLLLCVTLASQSLAFAHELDHLASGDTAPCMLCSVGSNLDAVTSDTDGSSASEAPEVPLPCRPDSIQADVFRVLLPARAPPASL